MSRKADFQIFNTSHGYGTSATVREVSHCTRLKYFTPVTVTGHQTLYEISATTVQDFEHYIRDWSLADSFIYPDQPAAEGLALPLEDPVHDVLGLTATDCWKTEEVREDVSEGKGSSE